MEFETEEPETDEYTDYKIVNFEQAKTKNRTFANRGKFVSVYKYDDQN